MYSYPSQPQQPLPAETTVKTYKSTKDFQKDHQRMAKQGWNVMGMLEHQPRSGLGRAVLLGGIGTLVFKPKPEIVVTYQRMIQPQSPKEPRQSTPSTPSMPGKFPSFKEIYQRKYEEQMQKRLKEDR